MLLVPTNFVVNPALFGTVPYDAVKDFDPVTLAVTSPMIISIHPSLPAQTIKELIALIKANPGKYSYASGGTGSPGHLVGEQFRLQLGLDLVHVPFQSAGLAVGSAIGNHTPIVIVSPSPTVPQVQDGKLRALAVTRKVRSKALPSVPTMTEAGYPDISGENWFAFIVPAGTPKEITALLHREIVKIVALPDVTADVSACSALSPLPVRPMSLPLRSRRNCRNGRRSSARRTSRRSEVARSSRTVRAIEEGTRHDVPSPSGFAFRRGRNRSLAAMQTAWAQNYPDATGAHHRSVWTRRPDRRDRPPDRTQVV